MWGRALAMESRSYCSQTSVNWLGHASAGLARDLRSIVNPAMVSLSLCLFFGTNGAFLSFVLIFLLSGVQWQVVLFSPDKWLVRIVFQLPFMEQGQYMSFIYTVLTKLCLPFLFLQQPSAYLQHLKNFLAVTCLQLFVVESAACWAAVSVWKQSYVADWKLVTTSWCNQAPGASWHPMYLTPDLGNG